MDIIFNEEEVRKYCRIPLEAEIITSQNQLFEKTRGNEEDVVLIEVFDTKMIIEKKFSFKKDKLYRIISPKPFNNLESFQLVTFGTGIIDHKGDSFSVYENTRNSILVKFKEDTELHCLVLWINEGVRV